MPLISSNGCRLNVIVEGPENGVPVMLSHYLGGRLETFDAQMPALAGRRVIRFDTRGHGASEAPEGDYSVAMLGADVLAILDALAIERVDFVGCRGGGMTGMWLGSEHPERVGRLVLANTIPNKPIWEELADKAHVRGGMAELARNTITNWLSESFRAAAADKIDALVAYMEGMPVAGYVGNMRVLRDVDLRAALPRIAAHTLVIGGAEDGPRGALLPIITAGVQNGRSVVLSGAAHLSHIENPAAFNAELERHLALQSNSVAVECQQLQ